MMDKFNNNHSFLALCIIGFFAFCRVGDIYIPYSFDELDVYAPGILLMYDHCPSLLPESIPSEVSRGHPLLFHFIGSLFFKIFGPTLEAGHIFSLGISTIWLFLVYVIGSINFRPSVAIGALLLLVGQPMVIAQSTMLLPETLLALFSMTAIHFYLKEKGTMYAIFSALALMTKESGLVLPLTVILFQSITFLLRSDKSKITRIEIWQLLFPFLPFFTFIFIQKIQNGWFFFPLHINLISFSASAVTYKLLKTSYFLMVAQGKYVLSILFLVSFIYLIRKRGQPKEYLNGSQGKILFLIVFILAFLAYSSVNFYNNRYFLIILGPLYLCISFFINLSAPSNLKFITIILLAAVIPIIFYAENKGRNNLDADLGYKHMVYNHLRFMKFLDKQNFYGKKILVNYPIYESNLDVRLGYTKRKFNFTEKFDSSVEYVAVLLPAIYPYWEPQLGQACLIRTFTEEYSKIMFYKINKPGMTRASENQTIKPYSSKNKNIR